MYPSLGTPALKRVAITWDTRRENTNTY